MEWVTQKDDANDDEATNDVTFVASTSPLDSVTPHCLLHPLFASAQALGNQLPGHPWPAMLAPHFGVDHLDLHRQDFIAQPISQSAAARLVCTILAPVFKVTASANVRKALVY